MRARARSKSTRITAALTITSDNTGPYKIPHDPRRDPAADQARQRHDQPARVHVQPDQLQPDGDHRERSRAPKARPRRCRCRSRSRTARRLKFAPKFAVSTSGKTSKANGASLTVKLTYPKAPFGIAGEHRAGQGRPPQAAPLAADDAAEGVHRRAVRSEPRGLPRGVDHRAREGDHAAAAGPVGRPGVSSSATAAKRSRA